MLASAAEFNRPNITDARPDFPDIDPAPAQLIRGRAEAVITGIDGWATLL